MWRSLSRNRSNYKFISRWEIALSNTVCFTLKLLTTFLALFAFVESGFSQTPVMPTLGQQAAYAELSARSASLSPEQKAQAAQLFSTGFGLWQSGDFAAAAIAFKQGLEIDPANAAANFYYGDSLLKNRDKKGAAEYLSRAVAMGGTSPESFKAKAALDALSTPVPFSEMTNEDLKEAYAGHWETHSKALLTGSDIEGYFDIVPDPKGQLTVSSIYKRTFFADHTAKNLVINGTNIQYCSGPDNECLTTLSGRLVSPERIEGQWSASGYSGPFYAVKKSAQVKN